MNIKNTKNLILSSEKIQNNIIKNTTWLIVAEVFNRGVVFILMAFTAKYLGVVDFGKLSSALAFVGIFSILTDFGMSTLFIKDVSKNNDIKDNYFSHIIILKIFLSLLFLGLLFLIINYFHYENKYSIVIYLSYIYTIILSFITFLRALFKSAENMKLDAISSIISGTILFVLIYVIIYLKFSLYILLIGYISASLIGLIITVLVLRKIHIFKIVNISRKVLKDILKLSSPFVLSTLCVYVYYYADQILLFNIKGALPTGIYSAAYRILTLLIAPISLFLITLLPIFSKNFYNNTISDVARNIIKHNVKYIFIVSSLIFIFLFVFATKIIILIYGRDYISASLIFRLLLISWFILVNYSVPVIGLQAFNQQNTYLKITFIGAIINVMLNLILIPRYSSVGAAITTIITEFLVGVCIVYIFIKRIWLKYEK